MFRRILGLLIPVALLMMSAVCANAQSGTGVVRGTVYDPAGAHIPGVKVVLTQVATNVSRETPTNEVGFFLFTNAAPGEYKLVAEAKGFKKWSGHLTLIAGQTAVVEPALEVGSLEVTVEVTSAAPIITTESSELGSVKDALRIQQLPLNGRSITQLFDLTPGVVGGGNPRVNGMKVGSTEMTLDGISLVDRFGGGMARVQPGLDTVNEFRIETVGSSAQYSRPATVTLVTKSGTNQLHGSLFETMRNNGGGLRARQRQDGNTAAFLVRNEFGVSAGGPVMLPKVYDGRNKTFWFFAYEGLRQRQKSFYQEAVATDAMWGGNFNNLTDSSGQRTDIYDPLTTNANGTRTMFPNNSIPASRMNPILATMKSVTHAPTSSVSPWLDTNMKEWYPVKTDTNNFTIKGDQRISDKDSISARYTHSRSLRTQTGGVFGAPRADSTDAFGSSRSDAPVHNGYVRWNRTFTPTFLNELMLGAHRSPKSSGTLADFTNWANKLGFPNPFGKEGWPTIYSDENSAQGYFGWDADNRKDEKLTAYILENNSTWIRGAHTVKFGGKFRPESNYVQELQQAQGSHNFGVAWTAQYDPASDDSVPYTGSGMASMALGLATDLGAQYNRGMFYFKQKEAGLYAEDTWKVSKKLTVNLGVRWDKWTAYKEKYDRMVNLDQASLTSKMEVITPGSTTMESLPGVPSGVLASWKLRGLTWRTADAAGLPANLISGDNNNLGPRLGMAYKLNDRTVLRASYGEFFWTMPLSQILQASRTNPPLNLFFNKPLGSLDGTGSYAVRTLPKPEYYLGRVQIDTNGIVDLPTSARGLVSMSPDWKDGHARSWHLTLEREVMKDTSLRLSYIGNHGSDLEQKYSMNMREAEYNYVGRTGLAPPGNRDLLRVNKDWNINAANRTGYSNTHSLQADFERRFNNGLAFQYFYVFTRAMTTSDAGGFTSGNGGINSTNGIFQVPEARQLLGGGNSSYEDRLRLGYQNSSNIPPHQMKWNGLYELPFGRGKKFGGSSSKLADLLIGGWQLAGLGEWRSGFWSGVSAGAYLFGDPRLSSDQQLLLKFAGKNRRLWFAGDFDPRLASNVDQTALQALVPVDRSLRKLHPVGANFNNQIPQRLANGTIRQTGIGDTVNWNSRAFFQGPSSFSTDMSLFKSFSLTEKAKLRFTADFINAFNHPVNVAPDATTGMQDLSVQGNEPRIIQLSLRLSW